MSTTSLSVRFYSFDRRLGGGLRVCSALGRTAAIALHARAARARQICGSSRNTSRDVPLAKQTKRPSSGLRQFSEQSALMRAPAMMPSGSKSSNSPIIGRGGTAAFQIPGGWPRINLAAGVCAHAIATVQPATITARTTS